MRIARIAAVAGVVGLAGCSVGTAPGAGAVSGNYKLQTNYQDAYRYATVQAERCLVGQGCYRVVGELDDNARTGLVRVVAPFFDGEMARVEIGTIDAHSSNVYIGMWGKSIWNTDALRAMREAVVYGVPSCVAYMPAIRRRPRKSLAPAQPLGSVAAGAALDDLERGGGLGHQFTGAVADLSFAEGDRRAAAQAARFDDQVAAPRGHEAGVHVDGGHADFGGVAADGGAQGEIQHAHQRAAVDVAAAVDQVGARRQPGAGGAVARVLGNHPEQLHEGNGQAEKVGVWCRHDG